MIGAVVLDKYEVTRALGEGSMGRVWLAHDRVVDRPVVVKVMHERIAAQPEFRELFEREMDLLSRLHHPHIVAFYDATSDTPFGPCIVLEYVDGTNLEEVLGELGPLTPGQVGKVLGPLCSALQAAHDAGIIHRDLKPANLMVAAAGTEEQTIKVMDFGLATLANCVYISMERLQGDQTAVAAGTPEYMPPEQVRGDEADHRADIYSVGVMLFEMLTGKLPFDHSSIEHILAAHAEEEPPTFASLGVEDVPPAIEAVVRTCLAKFPPERPQSAWELARRFGKALGVPIMEPPTAPGLSVTPANGIPIVRPGVDEANAVVRAIDAYMPERIAVTKLRGYVHDVGGAIVESVPGMIRVRLGGRGCRYRVPGRGGALAWLGLGSDKDRQIDMDMQMEKTAPGHSAQLHIKLLLRPGDGGTLPDNPLWHAVCERIYTELRGYLMGN